MLGSNIKCHGPSQLPAVTRLPCILASLAFLVCSWAGCTQQDPIVTYTVPTKIPAKLMPGKDRMLAAMLPKDKEIWFFKVTGPEEAIESLQGTFRDFVEDIEFQDGSPKLKELPDGWRRGGEKPFRYATLDVDTPDKQLGISVSSLPLRDDAWDQQVQDNVNRWRGQLGLSKSDQKWAGHLKTCKSTITASCAHSSPCVRSQPQMKGIFSDGIAAFLTFCLGCACLRG